MRITREELASWICFERLSSQKTWGHPKFSVPLVVRTMGTLNFSTPFPRHSALRGKRGDTQGKRGDTQSFLCRWGILVMMGGSVTEFGFVLTEN